MNERVLIITTVSPDGVNAVLDAVSSAGGGIIGKYSHCAFTSEGLGRFKPTADAHVGSIGAINQEDEVRVETFCERRVAKQVVKALRMAHPYEEPVIYILPLLNEDDL